MLLGSSGSSGSPGSSDSSDSLSSVVALELVLGSVGGSLYDCSERALLMGSGMSASVAAGFVLMHYVAR